VPSGEIPEIFPVAPACLIKILKNQTVIELMDYLWYENDGVVKIRVRCALFHEIRDVLNFVFCHFNSDYL